MVSPSLTMERSRRRSTSRQSSLPLTGKHIPRQGAERSSNPPLHCNAVRARGEAATIATKLLPVNILLPSFTSLLALSFGVVLLTRFVKRKQTYYLVWTLGLLWYAVAAGSEAVGAIQGWTPPLYKLWYATGAIGVAAYLGAGTIYLHKDPPFGSLPRVCFLIGTLPPLHGRP